MMERRQIVEAARQMDGTASVARVLVTLVHVEGSSYRRTGARLLTHPGGPVGAVPSGLGSGYTGTISGGCLEAEVVRKAAWKVRCGPRVERYSTLFDDTAEIPFGLGCGGTVGLLFEAAGTPEFNALIDALAESLRGEESTVITWLPGESVAAESRHVTAFGRAILRGDGSVAFTTPGIDAAGVASALALGSHWDPQAGGVHVERLEPPQRLVVFGAGDDAKQVVRMAALLGWSVVVVDGRSQLARPERFPEAQRVVVAPVPVAQGLAAREAGALDVTAADAVILMTHSYEQDRGWLAALLPIAPRYLGILGAKHRSSLLVSEAAVMAGLPLPVCCERIYAPVGLDLGGDGAEAIALAVVAEAHARCNGRLGRSLRLSAEDVSAQVERGGGSSYLRAHCAAVSDAESPELDAGPLR
jgi:xanthine/CO dehydrogenase XdhC/CoxF family maturation factor